ncbi:MAG TPA: 3D domain-containing protein [Blastocatellia bacterium]|nr:3D domain-containing protein [Blastocatellia bacterium]
MSPIHCRRFSAVVSILVIAVFAYSVGGGIQRVVAADNPRDLEIKSSEVGKMEVPGSFKDLPEAGDAITKKHPGEATIVKSAPLSLGELWVDANKGVSSAIEDRELLDFHATAYCLKGRTASGEHVRQGVIAADLKVLPMGTVVHLRAGRYTGTYTVLDTGQKIRGRVIDVYVPTQREAIEFGRRPVKIKVLGRSKRTSNATGNGPVVAEALIP